MLASLGFSPHFVELVGVGAEGGEYESRWADIASDPSGRRLTITLNDQARRLGIPPAQLVLHLLEMANPASQQYQSDFATAFQSVELVEGTQVQITWRFAPVKPIAFLRIPLTALSPAAAAATSYQQAPDPANPAQVRLEAPQAFPGPAVIVEQTFSGEEAAILALNRSDVLVLDDIAPWNEQQVRQLPDIAVAAYRLPTVHVLLCNYQQQPLVRRREFRRALCYGIDRQRLLSEVLAGEASRPGFRVLSGPLPAGLSIGDAIGYGYKQQLQPHPYEPRLAAVLHATARAAVAKKPSAPEPTSESEPSPEPRPLILVHRADPVATTMCQLIKRQLEALGIPLETRQLAPDEDLDATSWDLRYAELSFEEPLVDAQRLFGPGGLAGRCSPSMNLALITLSQATNWNDARSRLQQVHQVAFDDLPVIPLWQTPKFFASQNTLTGIGQTPVSLYQNVERWQRVFQDGGR